MSPWIALAGFLLVSFAAASSGAVFKPGRWYFEEIRRPWWTPPAWLFAPAWSLLYTAMSVAAWLVWREGGWSGISGVALGVFLAHLALNAAWSWLFFGRQRPDLAFWEVLALWGSILLTLLLFWSVLPLAGALMVPYLAWVSFAAVLNLAIWRLNPRA